MRTPWIWSVSLGRWWNVHVRLHMFFFLFAAFVLYLTSHNFDEPNWLGVMCAIVCFFSVLLHEIGHVVVARRLGGVADEIVIGPLGGLSAVRVPYEPHSELVAIMSGTLVNAAVCFISALTLAILQPDANLLDLLVPRVSYLRSGEVLTAGAVLKLVFWINWSLILINLVPAFPFDGARSLHAVLTFLWPEVDPRQSLIAICRLGRVVAIVLVVFAWTQFEAAPLNGPQPPAWLALTLLSIYIFFNARREELQQAEIDQNEDNVFGYDFSQGYTSLERSLVNDEEEVETEVEDPQLGLVGRWLEKRRDAQLQRQLDQEAEDERRVDEVLDRLHNQGMRSLSHADRELLDRVSRRYRSRQS